ncbi:MAG: PIN domain-containing protein [Promicromonosporaceae bacterium]|nr:PIN domain-containing protein [Promicromonosporaceae bacterium]
MTNHIAILDVNVLIALFDSRHEHHQAAHRWLGSWSGQFATCPLTASSFIRLISNPVVGGETTITALKGLKEIQAHKRHQFIPDNTSLADPAIDLTNLVGYRQVTDFHLVSLAAHSGAKFATFDGKLIKALEIKDRAIIELIPIA